MGELRSVTGQKRRRNYEDAASSSGVRRDAWGESLIPGLETSGGVLWGSCYEATALRNWRKAAPELRARGIEDLGDAGPVPYG